jgi:hypothetical protein
MSPRLPHFVHYIAKENSVPVIGIAVEEKSKEKVKKFVETHGMSWPISTIHMVPLVGNLAWECLSRGLSILRARWSMKYGPFKSVEEIGLDVIKSEERNDF